MSERARDDRAKPGDLDCEAAQLLVSRDLDDELPPLERERLEAHVAACASCARERAALTSADAWLEDAFAPEAFGAPLVRDVMKAVDARRARPAAPEAAPRGAIVAFRAAGFFAAAAAAVLFVALATRSVGPAPSDGGPVQPAPVVVARAYGKGLRASTADKAHVLATGELVQADERILNAGGPGTLFLGEPAKLAEFEPNAWNPDDPSVTRVDLRPDTALTVHVERDGGVTVSVVGGGVAYFEVAKQERPFRVATADLTATVLGTRFLVEATSDASRIVVVHGRVSVASATEHVVLSARQEAFVAHRSTLIARPCEPRALLAWNPRVLAALGPAPLATAAPAPAPAATSSPLQPPPGPKPSIDPNLDTPIK